MGNTSLVDIGSLITSTPGVNGGRPCIAGTGTSVQRIATLFRTGSSAEAIAAEYPHIDPKFIFAALTYYLANRSAFDAQIEADQEEGRRLSSQS